MTKKRQWAGILNILCGSLILPLCFGIGIMYNIIMMIEDSTQTLQQLLVSFIILCAMSAPILSIIIGKELLFPKSEKFKNKTGIIINILFKCAVIAILFDLLCDTFKTMGVNELILIPLIIFLVSILLDILVLFEERKKAKELK